MTLTTRRTALAGAAAFALAPVAALAKAGSASPIEALWRETRALDAALATHADAIAATAAERGIPGWMAMAGPANEIGEARYGKLVAILNAEPKGPQDLAIMAKAANHHDIANGPRGWAAGRIAEAALTLAA